MCKNQVEVEFAKDAPPICRSKKDAQHNLQQGREIPTHGREDKIINLRFTHGGTKYNLCKNYKIFILLTIYQNKRQNASLVSKNLSSGLSYEMGRCEAPILPR